MDILTDEEIPALKVVVPVRHREERGFFSEVWREDKLRSGGITVPFVQENHAVSSAAGVIRGMHFQIGPHAQAKLVRCPRGTILDVVVDIRHGSPTFGRHREFILSDKNWQQLFVPVGFAHGYCTLEPQTDVIYKVTAYYDPASERGIAWDDPDVGIQWPIPANEALLTSRDRSYPHLVDLPHHFEGQ